MQRRYVKRRNCFQAQNFARLIDQSEVSPRMQAFKFVSETKAETAGPHLSLYLYSLYVYVERKFNRPDQLKADDFGASVF